MSLASFLRNDGPSDRLRVLESPLRRVAGTICGADTDDPVFALTFDDGPDPANTPAILSVLAEHHANATFFLISESARRHPGLVDDIRTAGHDVALHAQRHIDLTAAHLRSAVEAVRRGRRELTNITGEPVKLFRPPYGTQSVFTYVLARRSGMEVVGWSASPRDFLALEPRRHVAITLADLEPGGIVLMHDGPPANPTRRVAVLRALLDSTAQRGWQAVSVRGLLAGRAPCRRLWFMRRATAVVEEMRPLLVGEAGTDEFHLTDPSL